MRSRYEFRHTDCGRGIEPPTPGLIEFVRQALGDAGGWPRLAPARSSWPKQVCSTPTRDHALVRRARLAGSVPKVKVEEGPHLHHRRPGVDLGRHDRGYRPTRWHDRKGSRRRTMAGRWPEAGGLSRRGRWPVQFSALLELSPNRPYPERTGLCEAQSRQALTVGAGRRKRRISARPVSAVRSAPRPANRRPRRREPARRGRPPDDGAEAAIDRRHRSQTGFADRNRMRRAFCAPSDSRRR